MSVTGEDGAACLIDSFVEVLPVPPQKERRRGILRFHGRTDFSDGVWSGVELVGSYGRNDGHVKGKRYFHCLTGQGIFVRPELVVPYVPAAAMAVVPPTTVQKSEPASSAAEESAMVTLLRKQLHEAMSLLAQQAKDATAELQTVAAANEEAARRAEADIESSMRRLASETQQKDNALLQVDALKRELKVQQEVWEARLAEQTRDLKAAQLQMAESRVALEAHMPSEQSDPPLHPSPQLLSPESRYVSREKEEELVSLRTALESAYSELQQLRSSKQEISETNTQLQNQISTMKTLNEEMLARCSSAAPALEVEVIQLRAELAQAQAAAEALSASLTDEKKQREAERAELELVVMKEQQRRDDIHAAEIAVISNERAELQQMCELLDDEIKAEKAQSDELSQLVKTLGAARDTQHQENMQLQEAKKTVDRLTAQLEALREKAKTPHRRNDQQESSTDEEELERLHGSVAKANPASIPRMRYKSAASVDVQSPASQANELARLQSELCRANTSLDEANAKVLQLSSAQALVGDLQHRCDELIAELDDQRQHTRTAEGSLQRQVSIAAEEVERLRQGYEEQCALLRAQLQNARHEVAELKSQKISSDEAMHRGLGTSSQQVIRTYEKTIQQLQLGLLQGQEKRLSLITGMCVQTSDSKDVDLGMDWTLKPLVGVSNFASP